MKRRDTILKYLPLLAIAGFLLLFGATLRSVSFEDILSFVPQNQLLAAVTLLALYALKSISIVFPLMALYISAGAIFPWWMAILINCAGLFVSITIPYYIGRFSGREAVERLIRKRPGAHKLWQYSTENTVFFAYLLRIINILPGDLVSMAMGASNIRYRDYAIGSMLGLLPTMIPAVFVGGNLEDPLSARFVIPFFLIVAISLISSIFYNRYEKRQRQKPKDLTEPGKARKHGKRA